MLGGKITAHRGIAHEAGDFVASIPDNGGVYVVPAFAGLGAAHWDMYARGLAIGLTSGTTRAHLARAVLESIAHQSADLAEAMRSAGQGVELLKVDGGGTANGWLMQFQADLLGTPVQVAAIQETTAFGAAALAGLAVGVFPSRPALRERWRAARTFEPRLSVDERQRLRGTWLRAVERVRGWAA